VKTLNIGGSPRARQKSTPNVKTAAALCEEIEMSLKSFNWLVWNANRYGMALAPVKGSTYATSAEWDINELLRLYPKQFAKLRPRNAWSKVLEDDEDAL
jgi:hypothetical protein